MRNFMLAIAVYWIFASFGAGSAAAFERNGVVVTTMNSGIYTYLEVETSGGRYWAAAPKTDLVVGDRVDVAPGSEMRDFISPTLNRKFDSIIFTSSVKVIGKGQATSKSSPSNSAEAKTAEGPAAVRTVEQIYTNKDSLKGKQVKVKGKVVKFNGGILGKNFLHIQDGSGKDGTNDLAVTSLQSVKVGDTITVLGTLDTDKDLGAGYTYKVILENATITPE
jgi:hypothetical protein